MRGAGSGGRRTGQAQARAQARKRGLQSGLREARGGGLLGGRRGSPQPDPDPDPDPGPEPEPEPEPDPDPNPDPNPPLTLTRTRTHLLGGRSAEGELPLRLLARGLQLRRGPERIDAVQQRELRPIGASFRGRAKGLKG